MMRHLRRQADRYGRLARDFDSRGDGAFLRAMAAGYRKHAERVAEYLEKRRR